MSKASGGEAATSTQGAMGVRSTAGIPSATGATYEAGTQASAGSPSASAAQPAAATQAAAIRRAAAGTGRGAERLSVRRLLELVAGEPLGGGVRRVGRDLPRLSRAAAPQLGERLGISVEAARRVVGAFVLGRRVEVAGAPRDRPLSRPSLVHRLMAPELRGQERESFHVLLLDNQHRLLERRCVSVGTLSASLVHPREVFRPALVYPAAAVICVHNHPSGDPEPSREDLEVTRRLVAAGKLLGVPLLDHVIVGAGYTSLRERMSFDP